MPFKDLPEGETFYDGDGCPNEHGKIRFDPNEKSITRRFLDDDKFRRIHDQWSMENGELLETEKDKYNFDIIIRNHARDFMDKMIERILEIENEV